MMTRTTALEEYLFISAIVGCLLFKHFAERISSCCIFMQNLTSGVVDGRVLGWFVLYILRIFSVAIKIEDFYVL
jgi:biotin transporter BioY